MVIIIPLYYCDQSLYLTIDKCLKSLKKYWDNGLCVIDDCSPLPLPPHWPIMIRNDKNLGYVKTVNKGLMASTADIIIVANDDLEFEDGQIEKFLEIDNIGIYSPRDTASGNLETFGAIFGMDRETFNKMGLLNEKFKNYFSDRDYYEKAKKLDIPVIKWFDIVVKHNESSTFKLLDKDKLFKEDMEVK